MGAKPYRGDMSGSFTVLAHTADTAIEVVAGSLGELFEWAANGMFSLMYDMGELEPEQHLEVVVHSGDVTELLVDTLSDLLYISEADDVIPCRFSVEEISATSARLAVGAVPVDPTLLVGPPIKAVTYHDLSIVEDPEGGWRARVVFDV